MLKMIAVILAGFMILAGCASGGRIAEGGSGTATATAQGFQGPVTVTIEVENGKLIKVEAAGPRETAGIGSRAIANLPARMVQRNSLVVDRLAGATITSTAIFEAARAAEAILIDR
jgi:fumarate reductase flavoprotein subunit